MNKLIIIGAGGHGKVVADAANQKCVFIDDNRKLEGVVGSIDELNQIQQEGDQVIVAIGNNNTRSKILSNVSFLATVIHPTAVISDSAFVSEGSVVFANVVVNPNSKIGRGCILNTAATVDHDCVLGECVHVSPGAHLGGNVVVGKCSWIGIGASVKHGVTIGNNVTVGAGAAVVADIPDNVTVVGVPAMETQQ